MEQKKFVIALVGEIASGKGTVADYLIQKHNAGYYRFSNILRDLADRLYLPHSRDILIRMSEVMRENFGEDTLAKVMAEDVRSDKARLVVVDGVRRLADIEYLKQLPYFYLVYVKSDINIRYERVKNRGEKVDEKGLTFKQFLKDNQRSTEISITQVADHADLCLINESTKEELENEIESLLEKLQTELVNA